MTPAVSHINNQRGMSKIAIGQQPRQAVRDNRRPVSLWWKPSAIDYAREVALVRGRHAPILAQYWLVLPDATYFAGSFYVENGGLTHNTRWDTPSGSFTYAFAGPRQQL